ncbi:MAG: hypothetical protein WAQ53_04655 [Thiofilum sp.]|uniref:hypothetical protein n=1 Tax=Thiofilum sp. TaxID=2212733 RepID=UPI0025ECC664|nr:hypothetical protein [Thiofilum sp.]MBK8452963.1 hypothetical protein [Thiofilum sp.]
MSALKFFCWSLVLFASFLSSTSHALTPSPSLKKALDAIYDSYDKKHQCWRHNAEGEYFYCFKLDRIDQLETAQSKRLYVLLAGAKYTAGGENGAHAEPGMVGAFVFKQVGEQLTTLVGDPSYEVGSWGKAPTQWQWVKLGPDHYWGWKNSWSDGHQGAVGSRYTILAPYGKGIKEIADIIESYDDAGACMPETGCKPSSYSSTLKIDSTQFNNKVFPLILTASGKKEGKPIKKKTWIVPFNLNKWQYEESKDWPMSGLDY